jgi:tetratricopeptide (TPR) repeat protein
LSQHPEDQHARFVFAEALQESGETPRAIEQYEKLIAGRPTAAALNNLAWAYQTAGDQRALATAKRAYDLAPKAAAIVDTYGWILLASDKATEASAVLKQAVALAGNNPDISYHYAVALSRTGERNAAKARLFTLLATPSAFSTQADARQLLNELSRRQ